MESLLFNSRVSLSVDLYKKRAKGLLFPVTLPDILGGATHPNTNIGVVQNTGFDVTLGYKRSPGKNWNWDIGLTFTSYRNKITKLGNANFFNPSYVNAAFGAIPYVRNQIGQSIGSFELNPKIDAGSKARIGISKESSIIF